MPQENVKTVRAVFEAVNSRDYEAMFALYADDSVVDMSESIGPENRVYRGRKVASTMWLDWQATWELWTWEEENVTEVGPDTVVVAVRVRGRGRGSGIEVDARVGQLWRVADGRITYVKMFQSEAEALEAAGAA